MEQNYHTSLVENDRSPQDVMSTHPFFRPRCHWWSIFFRRHFLLEKLEVQILLKFALLGPINNTLHWHHNGHNSVSNHQPHDCLLKRLFRRTSKKTSKLRVTGLCAGNSPGTGELPAQMASNTENASIWWRHHEASMRAFSPGNGLVPNRGSFC